MHAYRTCQDCARRIALYSNNETLDDVATGELRYFLVDFHLATLIQRQNQGSDRKSILMTVMNLHRSFLDLCYRYQACPASYTSSIQKMLSSKRDNLADCFPPGGAANRREFRIKQFKSDLAMKEQLQVLADSGVQDEDRLRSFALLTTQLAVSKSLQDAAMIIEELDLLNAEHGKSSDQRLRAAKSISDTDTNTWTLDIGQRNTIVENGKVGFKVPCNRPQFDIW